MRKCNFAYAKRKVPISAFIFRFIDSTIPFQHLCFCFIGSTIPLLTQSNFKPLAIFCGCTALFVSDLVGNPEDSFSRDKVLF